ncbi:hypothetical protein CDL60_00800 [Roseateles noduli]|nr:hypothetical protein CDL60_00800 [Roseateles noduli]
MDVAFHANIADTDTSAAANELYPVFQELGSLLRGDYGGTMEHLWIQLELLEYLGKPDGSPRHPFRFQKRVSGRSRLGLPSQSDSLNVGHYSVRPDFARIVNQPAGRVVPYVLSLIHESLDVLETKSKRLGGFDAERFKSRYREACEQLGHPVT